ncbi:MAG: ribonuclease P protein component [Anaerolineales bacterium]|nr:ribonuclease P protein component [Anaerolineales bacterium]
MQRKYRLKSPIEFKRVRREGKSYAHPLIVLIAQPNQLDYTRIGVAASRAVGNAVQRNRAKRRLRETARMLLPGLPVGWDLILLARRDLNQANFSALQTALHTLLQRAGLNERTYAK